MPIDWKKLVSSKVRDIVQAAQNARPQEDTVCAVLDIDDARAGRVSPGVQQLIADTKLAGAIPISDGQGHRLVCIPVGLKTLILALTKHEQTADLEKQIKTGGSLLWVICFDGEERTCVDIHVHSPEHN
jgi:hypothetical protein